MRAKLFSIWALIALLSFPASAAEAEWLTELEAAQTKAKAEKKLVLLFFHGSDWCPPCIAMDRKVLSTPEFREYAAKNLVLVDVDFPSKKQQPEALKQKNLELKKQFNVGKQWREGFPTIVVLNLAGETVFQEKGYRGETPAEFIATLKRHQP